jgi:hypothetical protein
VACLGMRDAALVLQAGNERNARRVLAVVWRRGTESEMAHAGVHAAVDTAAPGVKVRTCVETQPVVIWLVDCRQSIGLAVLAASRSMGVNQRTCCPYE